MSNSIRRRSRHVWTQPLAALLVISVAARTWAAPADITAIPAPMLGADPPKTHDISDGDASVSTQTGALTYAYPISVPPGRMGMEPRLALAYSSQAPIYGGVASGWSLGIPEIRLDTSESVLAMEYGATATDAPPPEDREKYITTLSGSRPLVEVSEPFFPANDVLRTYRAANDDSYVRYERLVSGAVGRWRARTPDGLTHTFGESSLWTGGSQFAVPLTSSEDGFGNRIEYQWANQQIVEIRYTSNPAAGMPAFAKVQFDYVDESCAVSRLPIGAADDMRLGTREGARKLTKIRAIAVDGSGDTQHTREYTLAYDAAAAACNAVHAPQRVLTSIQESAWITGQSHTNLPPVTFAYNRLEPSFQHQSSAPIPWASGSFRASLNAGVRQAGEWNGITSMMLDFNGDALPDRLEIYNDPTEPNECKFTWAKNLGVNPNTGQVDFDWSTEATPITMPRLPWANGTKGGDEHCYLNYQVTRAVTPGYFEECQDPAGPTHLAYRWIDVTSDGMTDLVAGISHDNHFDPTGYSGAYFDKLHLSPAGWPTCSGGLPDGGACPALSGSCVNSKLSCVPGRACDVAGDDMSSCMSQAPHTSCGALFRQGVYDPQCMDLPSLCYSLNPDEPPPNPASCSREVEFELCDRFPWLVYRNHGAGFDTGTVKLAPAPLESEQSDSPAGGGGAVFSRNHAVIDIDGDGHLDIVLRGSSYENTYHDATYWVVFRGDGTGAFHGDSGGLQPYVWLAPRNSTMLGNCTAEDGYCGTITLSIPEYDIRAYSQMADLNGDGAPDLTWTFEPSLVAQAFFNEGTKFRFFDAAALEGEPLGAAIDWLTRSYARATTSDGTAPWAPWNPQGLGPMAAGWKSSVSRLVDIDGDGRVDVAWAPLTNFASDPKPTTAFMNSGGSFQPGVTLSSALRDALVQRTISTDRPGQWATTSDLIDMDGNGIPEPWSFEGAPAGSVNVMVDSSDQPMRLLRTINNGRGGSVEVLYAPTTNSTYVTQDPSAVDPVTGARKALPSTQWVVKSLRVSDQWDPDVSNTTYHYDYPIWNKDERGRWGFRGFESVTSTLPSGARTVDTYDFDVDWSGRLAGTKTYASGVDDPANATALLHPSTISETTWNEYSLFGGALKTYHATFQKHWTCTNGQTEAACKAASSGFNQRQSMWTAQAGQLWTETEIYTSDSVTFDLGDRRVFDGYTLYSTPTAYRLKQSTHAELQFTAPPWQFTWLAYEENNYSADFRQLDSQAKYFDLVSGSPDASTRAITSWGYDPVTGVTVWSRDPHNQQTGLVESYGYDATKRFVVTSTNELGHVTNAAYEPGTGAQLWQQGPNGSAPNLEQTWTDVDGLGRPIARYVNRNPGTGPWVKTLVSRTFYTDDIQLNVPTHVVTEGLIDYSPLPARWTHEETRLDGQGRPIQTIATTGASTPNAVTTFDYDASGHVVSATLPDPTQNSTATVIYSYTFDSLGRPTTMRRPAVGAGQQSGVNLTYNGLTSTSEEVAGGQGGPVARKVLVKDNLGRLIEVREYTNLATGTYASTFYQYDGHDIVSRIQNPDGVVTQLVHDLGGRRTSIVRGGRTWTYAYYPDGNLWYEVVPGPAGTSTNSYAYNDALGRLTSRSVATRGFSTGAGSDADTLGIGTISFSYDSCANGLGRLCTVTHPSNRVVTAYAYDSEGNTASTTRTFNFGGLANVSRTESFTYGPAGRVVDQYYADNKSGQTTVTKTTYGYDDRAKPSSLLWTAPAPATAGRAVATQVRNVAGLVTTRTAGLLGTPGTTGWKQFQTTFAYDKLTRVASQTIRSATNTSMTTGVVTHASQSLGYFGLDDPSTLQHVMGTATYNFTFGYDAQHQLTTVGEGGGKYSAAFTYGVLNAGNPSGSGKLRTAVVGPTTLQSGSQVIPRSVTYQYATGSSTIDPEAPTGLVTTATGLPFTTYTYESSGTGNLKTSTRNDLSPSQTDTFDYDGEDQLRRAKRTKATTPFFTVLGTEEYYYDHNGVRVGVVTRNGSGTITGTRIFAGDTEIEFSATGVVNQAYAYLSLGTPVAKVVSPSGGWASTTPSSWTNGNTVLEFQYHGLSSNTLLSITPNATVQSGFVYAPYGDVVQTTGAAVAAQHRRFNDKFQDDLTKLSYYGVRYYDGLSLNWTQADPMYRFVPDAAWAEPRKANLYQFDLGNPVRYIDPDGRQAKDHVVSVGKFLWKWTPPGAALDDLQDLIDYRNGDISEGDLINRGLGKTYDRATVVVGGFFPPVGAAMAIARARTEGEAGAAIMAGGCGGLTFGGKTVPVAPEAPSARPPTYAETVGKMTPTGDIVNPVAPALYRSGGSNPGNLVDEAGEGLSARTSLSNPLSDAGKPVPTMKSGQFIVIDPAKLPAGSVVVDNNPFGHVNIFAPAAAIKQAIIDKGKLPK